MTKAICSIGRILICSLQLLWSQSCINPKNDGTLILREETVLPTLNSSHENFQQTQLQISSHLLPLKEIIRPQAELREGPGIHFSIKDTLIRESTLVISLHSLGIWQKIYVPEKNLDGWVHFRTLGEPNPLPASINIPIQALPAVFAKENLFTIFDYETKKPLKYPIPKGAFFHAIKKQDNMFLIYLKETGSVAWLKAKDVL